MPCNENLLPRSLSGNISSPGPDEASAIRDPVKGAINDSGKIIRRPQQHREDRGGGGAYRYTHGHGERPGLCGARFRRHAEYAGCAPGAAASGSTHRCTTAATASPSTSAGSAEGWLQRLLLWQLWQSGRRRRWRLENYEPPLTIWTTQSGWVKPNAAHHSADLLRP